MRLLICSAVFLISAAAPVLVSREAAAGIGPVFSSTSLFQATAASSPLDLSPADFELSWDSALSFRLQDLTPASVDGTHVITSANAADFGIDWQALHDAVDHPLAGGSTSVGRLLETPLGNFSAVCCSAHQFNRPNPTLSHVTYTVTRWGAAPPQTPTNPNDAGIFVEVEVGVYVTTYRLPEPASAAVLLPCVGLVFARRRHGARS